jgi:HEAT repeat protein
MSDNFGTVLIHLADESRPVHSIDLEELSDVARSRVGEFRLAWATYSAERRRELIATMVEQAEANIHMNFHVLLRTCLTDSDAQVRRHAIEGLWEDEKASLIQPLMIMLANDEDAGVRAAAAVSLGRFVLLGELAEIAADAASAAEQALRSAWFRTGEVTEVRRRALEGLAYTSSAGVHELIQNAYYDEDVLMRQSAVFSMGRSNNPRWGRIILDELGSQEPALRYEAAQAAGEMGLKSAVQPLVRRLEDGDASVRHAAASALGKIGGPAAKRALESLLGGPDEALGQAAEEALEELAFNSENIDNLLLDVEERARRQRADLEELGDEEAGELDDTDDDLDDEFGYEDAELDDEYDLDGFEAEPDESYDDEFDSRLDELDEDDLDEDEFDWDDDDAELDERR